MENENIENMALYQSLVRDNEAKKEFEKPIGVYVKLNEEGFVTDVNSDIFISNFDGWAKIDEGYGDKFAHAQSNYFETPLIDENGNYVIKVKE